MSSISHHDSNRELVIKLADIHNRQSDPEGILKQVKLQDPDYVCRECARLVLSGSIEVAVELVRNRRILEGGAPGRISVPSHLVAQDGYREVAEENKAIYDEDVAADLLGKLRSENEDLKRALSQALVDVAELKEAAPAAPATPLTVAGFKALLRDTADDVIQAMPYIGEGNLSAVRAWAETDEPADCD